MTDDNLNNDDRAAAVEKYLLDQAVKAGVVKEIKFMQPKNPNKLGKVLAPWYNDNCREAKRELQETKRNYGKGDDHIL